MLFNWYLWLVGFKHLWHVQLEDFECFAIGMFGLYVLNSCDMGGLLALNTDMLGLYVLNNSGMHCICSLRVLF